MARIHPLIQAAAVLEVWNGLAGQGNRRAISGCGPCVADGTAAQCSQSLDPEIAHRTPGTGDVLDFA